MGDSFSRSGARPLPAISMPKRRKLEQTAPKPTYLEMVEHLEGQIQSQLQQVKQVLDAKHLAADQLQMTYAVDITGNEVQVCLACGRVGHDYMPTMVRQQNPEIDMLSESLVVFLEVASRLGIPHGLLAYDDEGVLVLRKVSPPEGAEKRAQIINRFEKFKARHTTPDITDRDWMAEEAKSWIPSDANRKVRGAPDDRGVAQAAKALYAEAPAASYRTLTIAKSEKPAQSMLGIELDLKFKKIFLSGIAIGKEANQWKAALSSSTVVAADMHELSKQIGHGMSAALAKVPQQD